MIYPDFNDDNNHRNHPYNALSDTALHATWADHYEKWEVLGLTESLHNCEIARKIEIRRARGDRGESKN